MIRYFIVTPIIAALLAGLTVWGPNPAVAQDTSIIVFAAASTKDALDDVNAAFTKTSGVKVVTSYAASSALAKQIESGAPADVFVSADLEWMDYLAEKKTISMGTRVNLLGNRLVLIAPKDSRLTDVTIGAGFDLARLAGDERIATGNVKAVPVGRYAKTALENLGAWVAAEKKFAMADNVRAALLLVARGEAALGIVYATDARVEGGVKIIGTFPDDAYPPVIYPAAATANAKPEAAGYLSFLQSGTARSTFEKFGFTVLNKPAS